MVGCVDYDVDVVLECFELMGVGNVVVDLCCEEFYVLCDWLYCVVDL